MQLDRKCGFCRAEAHFSLTIQTGKTNVLDAHYGENVFSPEGGMINM